VPAGGSRGSRRPRLVSKPSADEFSGDVESNGQDSSERRMTQMTATDLTTDGTATGAYAEINGLRLYYETHGEGAPLVLLHGGLMSGETLGPLITPLVAAGRRVITPDLQGHGRTADIDRPIDARLMADDIAALIRHLDLGRPDVVGYSLGGGVAFQTAVKHPELVRRLVSVSAHIRRDAIYPEMLGQQEQVGAAAAEFMKDTPMYELYARVAPRPQDFPRLLDKIGASMARDFDFSEDVRGLRVPTMIACGDADMAPPSHYVEIFRLLDGGQRDGGWMGEGRPKGGHALAIIPNATHYNVSWSPVLAAAIITFLDAPAH
jgi:pimeloyl-ACP methyl ester carboxylesterase